jgi:transcriptional regulator with XRE-family HTH domain
VPRGVDNRHGGIDSVSMSTEATSASRLSELETYVIGEILALMGRRRMSNAELGRRLGVPDYWVGRRLAGRIPMDLNDVQRVAAMLGVSASDLFPPRNTQSKSRDPLAPRVLAAVGQERTPRPVARVRTHRPGRGVSQTRPVDRMVRPETPALAGR